jgi:hypothetical protein
MGEALGAQFHALWNWSWLKDGLQQPKSEFKIDSIKPTITNPLERLLLMTIRVARSPIWGRASKTGTVLGGATPMLLNGGYGYGWF